MTALQTYLNSISPLSSKTWNKVQQLFSEGTLQKGHHFIPEGKVEKRIAFLQQGIVRAYYRNNEGVEYNKYFFVAPSIIGGYSSLITGQPNQVAQQALTDCKIWAAGYHHLVQLFNTYPDLERLARKQAELTFVEKEKREIDLVMLEADERYLVFKKQYPALEQIIPQYHIASYLGITPTQLSRIRAKRK